MDKIVDDERNIKNEIFKEYFGCQLSIIFSKRFKKASQSKNEQMLNQINDALVVLRNAVKFLKKKIQLK